MARQRPAAHAGRHVSSFRYTTQSLVAARTRPQKPATTHAANPPHQTPPTLEADFARRRPRPTGPVLGFGLGTSGLACVCTSEHLHSLLGEIIAAAVIVIPSLTAAALLAVAVFGNTQSSDRVFRLLRWIRGREEPRAPNP